MQLDTSPYEVLSVPTGLVRITRDGEPVSPILPNATTAFGWLLRHVSYSVDHALRHEGYGSVAVEVEPRTDEERRDLSAVARRLFRHEHGRSYASEWDEDVTRSSCSACALAGYGEVSGADSSNGLRGPNYAAWSRVYVQAGRPVRERWRASFLADLNEEGEVERTPSPYAVALRRDVATWGVRFVD